MTLSLVPVLEAADRPMPMARALLISLHPRFAHAILDGSKTIEVRRTKPSLPSGALVLLYASSPTKAILGTAHIGDIIRSTPVGLWAGHGDRTGITRHEFDRYFAGATAGYGLQLEGVRSATAPMSLSRLRKLGLQPPQSWRYVDTVLAERISAQLAMP